MPPSVRFLGRRVYFGAVVVLVCALRDGLSPRRVQELRGLLGVDRRTLRRWQAWWREGFAKTAFWRTARAGFVPTVDAAQLPGSLLERFVGADESVRLCRVLRFLTLLGAQWHADPRPDITAGLTEENDIASWVHEYTWGEPADAPRDEERLVIERSRDGVGTTCSFSDSSTECD